jgi:hypothetical protein
MDGSRRKEVDLVPFLRLKLTKIEQREALKWRICRGVREVR